MAHPKTMLSNQNHLQQKHSQAHHWQGIYIHLLQSGCQTMIQHGPGTISVLNDGLCQNTIIQVDGPGTNQIPICTQGQLNKINWKISDPPTRYLLVWNSIPSIMHALCRRWRICFWIQDRHRKRDHPSFQSLRSVWPRNAHWHRKKTWRLNA